MGADLSFYKGKKIFLTGHTGFKGTWLCRILILAGAEVTGYSLNPPTVPSLFAQAKTESQMKSIIGDIRDGEKLIGSLQLFFIGFLGEYIMSINTQIMNRPLVIEEERINWE